jgi:hypothetical protein
MAAKLPGLLGARRQNVQALLWDPLICGDGVVRVKVCASPFYAPVVCCCADSTDVYSQRLQRYIQIVKLHEQRRRIWGKPLLSGLRTLFSQCDNVYMYLWKKSQKSQFYLTPIGMAGGIYDSQNFDKIQLKMAWSKNIFNLEIFLRKCIRIISC